MDMRAMADELVARLGKTLTVPELVLGELSNSCALCFDGDILVNLEYDTPTERLVLSAYLDELPSDNAEPLLRLLMGANLYWHRTQGATLALEEGTGGVLLIYGHRVAELDDALLERVLENFVAQATKWQGRIAQYKTDNAPTANTTSEPSPSGQAMFFA